MGTGSGLTCTRHRERLNGRTAAAEPLSVNIHNTDVADAFDEIGDLLSIQGENAFRIRAYRRAAQVVRTLPSELAEVTDPSAYDQLPGIGKDLAGKITEIIRTGHLKALDRLRRQVPSGVRDLLVLPAMGPVRVRALVSQLHVDILEDGQLALPDASLAKLDVVIIAVHSHFDLPESRQTTRVLRALERPHVSILAHPSGRLLGERKPYALDFARVLDAAHERGCFLEVNGQPLRLDLDDVRIKAAIERGVLLSIASDAHSIDQLGHLDGGVRQARRGWARKEDVLNTRPLAEMRQLLRRVER